jgi:hypothetical protein
MTTPPPSDSATDEVRRIADGQIRMEAKLDAIHSELRLSRTTLDDHEARLRHLELDRVTPTTATDHENRLRHLEERRLPHSVLTIVTAALGTAALVWQAIGH